MEIVAVILLVLYVVFRYTWYEGRNAPFVPTEAADVERVMNLAEVGDTDIVYDLGSGDGRYVMAAGMRGAKAVGIELDLLRVLYSRFWLWVMRLSNHTKIIRDDIFDVDLSEATVVICYLLQETNDKLQEKLIKELKPGTRIVSVAFEFDEWQVEKIDHRGVIYGPLRLYVNK